MEMNISGYKVFYDCKDEGLFYAKEHDLEVEDLHDGYLTEKETVTEDSGNDEVLVDEDLDMKTTFKFGLRESNNLDGEAKGEETVKVKEVKSDFVSPETAPIVANSDQKSLSSNQALKKLEEG